MRGRPVNAVTRAELEEIRADLRAVIAKLNRLIEQKTPEWTDTGSGPGDPQ